MREINSIAWNRLKVIAAILGDVNGRLVLTAFYFTVLMPFGIGSALFSDPLHKKETTTGWLKREPVSSDVESAKQQG